MGAVKRDRLSGEAEAPFSGDALKPRELGTGMVLGFGTVVSAEVTGGPIIPCFFPWLQDVLLLLSQVACQNDSLQISC